MTDALPKEPNANQTAAAVLRAACRLRRRTPSFPKTDRKAVAQRYADRSKELTREAAKRSGEESAAPGQKPKQ